MGSHHRILTPDEQAHLVENIVLSLSSVSRDVQTRQIAHFYKADPDYGAAVEKGIERILSTADGTMPRGDGTAVLMNAPHIDAAHSPDGPLSSPESSRAPLQQ